MSPKATMRALVFLANEVATLVPRFPHPRRARRTAEFAWYPQTVRGLRIRKEAAAALRPKSRLEIGERVLEVVSGGLNDNGCALRNEHVSLKKPRQVAMAGP